MVQIHSARPHFFFSKTEYVEQCLPCGRRASGVESKPAPFAKTAKDAAPAPLSLHVLASYKSTPSLFGTPNLFLDYLVEVGIVNAKDVVRLEVATEKSDNAAAEWEVVVSKLGTYRWPCRIAQHSCPCDACHRSPVRRCDNVLKDCRQNAELFP